MSTSHASSRQVFFLFFPIESLWSSCFPSIHFFLDSKRPKKNRRYCNKQTRKGKKKVSQKAMKKNLWKFWHPSLDEGDTGKSPKKLQEGNKPKEKKKTEKPKNRKHPQLTDIEKILGGAVKGKKVKPEILKPASISRSQQFLRWGWISRRTRK